MSKSFPAARLLPLLAIAALTGCSRPPGDADASAALEKLYSGLGVGGFMKPESVKVLACEKLGEAYRCDVTIGMLGNKTTAAVRFIKTGEGWVASQ